MSNVARISCGQRFFSDFGKLSLIPGIQENGMRRLSALALGLILAMVWAPAVCAQARNSEGPALVGRITFIDGQLLRYVYDEQDWVATVKDAPFGLEDAVYSSDTGKAEFKLPNGAWVRTGSDTQIQLIVLRNDLTEIDIASGTVRFYNKSQKALIKATTPFGYVLARPGAAFDLYVGDDSAEVISLDGAVDLVLGEVEARYAVKAGGASIISDGRVAVEGDGLVDAAWDEWNLKREELWTQRVQVKGESIDNLPAELRDDAYVLDRNGRWEKVYYEGRYRKLWRPTGVAAGWQPFTVGRWTVWYRDNVWIPEESFGYVTHHYGNWVLVNSVWYWAPPVKVRVGNIGGRICWYPGRVSWIQSDADVGWVPLAPGETYYSHKYWGPGSFIVRARGGGIGIGRLAYAGHAVVVPRGSFYSVNSYTGVRVANINRTTIINNYRTAPVISDSVIPDYSSIRNRHIFDINLALLAAKPHQAVVERINRNRMIAPRTRRTISAVAVQRDLARISIGKPVRDPQAAQRVQKLRITSRIVPEDLVHRPRSEVQFVQRVLKTHGKQPQRLPGLYGPGAQPLSVTAPQTGSGERFRRGEGVRHGKRIRSGATAGERQLREQRLGRHKHRRQGPRSHRQKRLHRVQDSNIR
jgi:hypothetical protein